MPTADQAILDAGLNGPRVLAITRDVVRYKARSVPHMSPVVRDDLESYLSELACSLAVNYSPERSRPGYSFASYLWDVLALRTTDFFRRRREGFGDRRYGQADRIVLLGLDPVADEDLEDPDPEPGPFESRTPQEAAAEVADELRLSPEGTWTLTEIVARLAEGCGLTQAAQEAGVTMPRAKRAIEALHEELAERDARMLTGQAIS